MAMGSYSYYRVATVREKSGKNERRGGGGGNFDIVKVREFCLPVYGP